MSSLALSLNHLANANAHGLLDDHDYRILRQSAFEHHSADDLLPPERPVIPISRSPPSSPTTHKSKPTPATPTPPSTPSPRKLSLSSGVSNLFRRRAAGRGKPSLPPLVSASSSQQLPALTPDSPKRSVIPRILHKTHVDPTSPTSLRPPKLTQTPSQASLSPPYPSPSSPVPPLNEDQVPSNPEDYVLTAKQIREAMEETRAELQRLMDAFDILQLTTANRIKRHHPSLPPTPTSYTFADFQDPQKRRHLPLSPTRPNSSTTNSDGISIRSSSSALTSRSQSASIPPPNALASESRYNLFSLKRKNSVSSVSSQGASRRGASTSLSLSKSTGHLPPSILPESESLDPQNQFSTDPEMIDVRTRRQKVIDRYEARLEYLHAKLKGAELHEKLLRK